MIECSAAQSFTIAGMLEWLWHRSFTPDTLDLSTEQQQVLYWGFFSLQLGKTSDIQNL